MEKILDSELSIMQETKVLLEKLGKAEMVYVTAEFSPFSNQQRPDLHFTPKHSETEHYFLEYKFMPTNGFSESYMKCILEHKVFVNEDANVSIKYAFGTNVKVDESFQEFLTNNGVTVFSMVSDARKLVGCIIEWANIRDHDE
jgi:hypothetical protein